jgi:hypothetical protein
VTGNGPQLTVDRCVVLSNRTATGSESGSYGSLRMTRAEDNLRVDVGWSRMLYNGDPGGDQRGTGYSNSNSGERMSQCFLWTSVKDLGRDHRIGSRISGWRAGGKEARPEQRLPLAFSSPSLRRLGGPSSSVKTQDSSVSASVCVSVSTGEAQTETAGAQAHEAQKIAAARLCLRLCLCLAR